MYRIEDLDVVLDRIRSKNTKEIPTSDTFIKELVSFTGLREEDVRAILQKLRELNEIFTFEVVKEDKINKIEPIIGYVVADKSVIENLMSKYDRELEKIYAAERKIPKSASQILREPASYDRSLNNTPLGKAINICNMLRTFWDILDKNPSDFHPVKKREKRKELEKQLLGLDDKKSEVSYSQEEESIDYEKIYEEEYRKKVSDIRWENYDKAIRNFGFGNLMNYYIRKMDFDTLEKLLKENLIFRRTELEELQEKFDDFMRDIDRKEMDILEKAKIRKRIKILKNIIQEKMKKLGVSV